MSDKEQEVDLKPSTNTITEDVDIYADILIDQDDDTSKLKQNAEILISENASLLKSLTSLQEKYDQLQKKYGDIEEKYKKISHNSSSLFKTAQSEIARKDRMIQELRRENDNMIFRKGQAMQPRGRDRRRERSPEKLRPPLKSVKSDEKLSLKAAEETQPRCEIKQSVVIKKEELEEGKKEETGKEVRSTTNQSAREEEDENNKSTTPASNINKNEKEEERILSSTNSTISPAPPLLGPMTAYSRRMYKKHHGFSPQKSFVPNGSPVTQNKNLLVPLEKGVTNGLSPAITRVTSKLQENIGEFIQLGSSATKKPVIPEINKTTTNKSPPNVKNENMSHTFGDSKVNESQPQLVLQCDLRSQKNAENNTLFATVSVNETINNILKKHKAGLFNPKPSSDSNEEKNESSENIKKQLPVTKDELLTNVPPNSTNIMSKGSNGLRNIRDMQLSNKSGNSSNRAHRLTSGSNKRTSSKPVISPVTFGKLVTSGSVISKINVSDKNKENHETLEKEICFEQGKHELSENITNVALVSRISKRTRVFTELFGASPLKSNLGVGEQYQTNEKLPNEQGRDSPIFPSSPSLDSDGPEDLVIDISASSRNTTPRVSESSQKDEVEGKGFQLKPTETNPESQLSQEQSVVFVENPEDKKSKVDFINEGEKTPTLENYEAGKKVGNKCIESEDEKSEVVDIDSKRDKAETVENADIVNQHNLNVEKLENKYIEREGTNSKVGLGIESYKSANPELTEQVSQLIKCKDNAEKKESLSDLSDCLSFNVVNNETTDNTLYNSDLSGDNSKPEIISRISQLSSDISTPQKQKPIQNRFIPSPPQLTLVSAFKHSENSVFNIAEDTVGFVSALTRVRDISPLRTPSKGVRNVTPRLVTDELCDNANINREEHVKSSDLVNSKKVEDKGDNHSDDMSNNHKATTSINRTLLSVINPSTVSTDKSALKNLTSNNVEQDSCTVKSIEVNSQHKIIDKSTNSPSTSKSNSFKRIRPVRIIDSQVSSLVLEKQSKENINLKTISEEKTITVSKEAIISFCKVNKENNSVQEETHVLNKNFDSKTSCIDFRKTCTKQDSLDNTLQFKSSKIIQQAPANSNDVQPLGSCQNKVFKRSESLKQMPKPIPRVNYDLLNCHRNDDSRTIQKTKEKDELEQTPHIANINKRVRISKYKGYLTNDEAAAQRKFDCRLKKKASISKKKKKQLLNQDSKDPTSECIQKEKVKQDHKNNQKDYKQSESSKPELPQKEIKNTNLVNEPENKHSPSSILRLVNKNQQSSNLEFNSVNSLNDSCKINHSSTIFNDKSPNLSQQLPSSKKNESQDINKEVKNRSKSLNRPKRSQSKSPERSYRTESHYSRKFHSRSHKKFLENKSRRSRSKSPNLGDQITSRRSESVSPDRDSHRIKFSHRPRRSRSSCNRTKFLKEPRRSSSISPDRDSHRIKFSHHSRKSRSRSPPHKNKYVRDSRRYKSRDSDYRVQTKSYSSRKPTIRNLEPQHMNTTVPNYRSRSPISHSRKRLRSRSPSPCDLKHNAHYSSNKSPYHCQKSSKNHETNRHERENFKNKSSDDAHVENEDENMSPIMQNKTPHEQNYEDELMVKKKLQFNKNNCQKESCARKSNTTNSLINENKYIINVNKNVNSVNKESKLNNSEELDVQIGSVNKSYNINELKNQELQLNRSINSDGKVLPVGAENQNTLPVKETVTSTVQHKVSETVLAQSSEICEKSAQEVIKVVRLTRRKRSSINLGDSDVNVVSSTSKFIDTTKGNKSF